MVDVPKARVSRFRKSLSRSMGERVSLLVVEDNRLLGEGIAAALRRHQDVQVMAIARSPDAALTELEETEPQLVLLDAALVDHNGSELVEALRRTSPSVKVIVMGFPTDGAGIVSIIEAGATGFILKDANIAEFLGTVRSVAHGAHVLPPALVDPLFSQIARQGLGDRKARSVDGVRLTRREREIVPLIGEGLSNKEIGERLHIAIHTVKTHVHNILDKLAVRTRLQIATYAMSRRGSLRPDGLSTLAYPPR